MGAECWQMTACEAPSCTRLSPCLQPHTGLISMPTVHHACESVPLYFSWRNPSLYLSVCLLIYHFFPLSSNVCTCSFRFKDSPSSIIVSLLCLSSVFLSATCWCLSIRQLCKFLLKKFSEWKDTVAYTHLLLFHTQTHKWHLNLFKIHPNIIVCSWV